MVQPWAYLTRSWTMRKANPNQGCYLKSLVDVCCLCISRLPKVHCACIQVMVQWKFVTVESYFCDAVDVFRKNLKHEWHKEWFLFKSFIMWGSASDGQSSLLASRSNSDQLTVQRRLVLPPYTGFVSSCRTAMQYDSNGDDARSIYGELSEQLLPSLCDCCKYQEAILLQDLFSMLIMCTTM